MAGSENQAFDVRLKQWLAIYQYLFYTKPVYLEMNFA
jgi:hypothetical protein